MTPNGTRFGERHLPGRREGIEALRRCCLPASLLPCDTRFQGLEKLRVVPFSSATSGITHIRYIDRHLALDLNGSARHMSGPFHSKMDDHEHLIQVRPDLLKETTHTHGKTCEQEAIEDGRRLTSKVLAVALGESRAATAIRATSSLDILPWDRSHPRSC